MNEIKLGNIVEHDNFTPIKDTVHLLSSFPDNYKAAICKEKYKNVMSYPKGKRKINEDSTTCAMREFQEETGFVISPIIFSRDFQRDWRQFLKQETLPYEIKVFNTLFQIVIYE
jgi:8-oxo-dGTP pyrophosphatase MutT (NUDIX family)